MAAPFVDLPKSVAGYWLFSGKKLIASCKSDSINWYTSSLVALCKILGSVKSDCSEIKGTPPKILTNLK